MHHLLDYIAVWLPIAALLFAFSAMAFIISHSDSRVARFRDFTRIFLNEGASVKNWGLFISAFTTTLLLSGGIAVMSGASEWKGTDKEILLATISFFKVVCLGLEVLLAVVLGAFGAVAFKAQGPGGVTFELEQTGGRPTASTSVTTTGPVGTPQPVVPPPIKGNT